MGNFYKSLRKDANIEWICGKGDICTVILGIYDSDMWIWHDNGKENSKKIKYNYHIHRSLNLYL